jgi:hypothetical protein
VFEDDTSILLANTLSILPGTVLTSMPADLGYAVDMNGDLFSDLLIYLPDEKAIQVMLNDGLGQLLASAKVALEHDVTAFTAADINSDGNVDIITTGGATAGNRAYLLDNTFAVSATESLDDIKADIVLVADLDLDGDLEVLLAGIDQPQVAIYSAIGTGARSVTFISVPASLVPASVQEQEANRVAAVSGAPAEVASGITAVTAIDLGASVQLLVGVEHQAPVLFTLEDNVWTPSSVVALSQNAQRLIRADVDGDSRSDLFVRQDDGWHLLLDGLSSEFVESSVVFPQAEDIIVTDLEGDGISELLLVMSHGVSIWHYYGPNDIRPDQYAIDGEAIGTVTVLDLNNDGLLDIVTFDNQDGVSVWYVSAGGGVGVQDVDLSLFTTGPSFPKYGQSASMTWSVFNAGDADASDVVFSVGLDAALLATQIPNDCMLSEQLVTCRLGNLAVGDTLNVMLWVTPEKAQTFTLSGTVTSLEHDIDDSNNHSDVSFSVSAPNDPESDAGSVPLWALLLLFMCSLTRVTVVSRQ